MDLNENEVNQGVSIDTLLQVIGLRDVEGYVRDQGIKKIQDEALAVMKQNVALTAENAILKGKTAESVPVSPELEQLRKVNTAGDARVKQLEDQVHEVALERDALKAELKKSRDDYQTLQYVCDDLQKQVDAIPTKKPKKK